MISSFKPAIYYGFAASFLKFFELLFLPFFIIYFTKSEFGQLSLLIASSLFIVQFFTISINTSLIKNSSLEINEKNNILSPCLFISTLGSICFVALYLIYKAVVPFKFYLEPIVEYSFFIFCFIEIAIQPFFAYYQLKQSAFKYSFVYFILAVLSISITLILLKFYNFGIEAFFISYTISRLAFSIYSIKIYYLNIFFKFKKKILDILISDSLKFLPGIILLSCFIYNIRFILEFIEGSEKVGIFYVAQSIGMIFAIPVYGLISFWKILISKKETFVKIGELNINIYRFRSYSGIIFVILNLCLISVVSLLVNIFEIEEIQNIEKNLIYIFGFYLFFLFSNLLEIENYKKNKIKYIGLSYFYTLLFQLIVTPFLINLYSFNGAGLGLLLSGFFNFFILQIQNKFLLKSKFTKDLNLLSIFYILSIYFLLKYPIFLDLLKNNNLFFIALSLLVIFFVNKYFLITNKIDNLFLKRKRTKLFIGHGDFNYIESTHTKNLINPFLKNEYFFYGLRLKNFFLDFFVLNYTLYNKGISTLITCYGSWISFLALILKKKNLKLVITFCGDDINGSVKNNIYWKVRSNISILLSNLSTLRANTIITKSNALKQKLYFSSSKKKSFVIPNGVDLDLIKPLENMKENTKLRAKHGFKKEDFIIVFNKSVGLNQTAKNYPLAKKIIKKIKLKYHNVRFVTVTNLKYKQFINLLSISNLLLVTSIQEGSPNVVKEAMAMNIPIISSNCGDVEERLNNTNNSYVINKLDEEIFVKKISDLIDYKAFVVSNGRDELYKQGLDSKRLFKKLQDIYK